MRARAAALVALGLLGAAPGRAHVVYERATLREWIGRSALVVVAELESDTLMWQAPDGSDRQEHFRARALETLRGAAPAGAFDFFPHAEGFPSFRAGERVLLFLEPTADRIEFAALAPRFAWFSVQGAGQEWKLDGPEGVRILEIARRWSALLARGSPDAPRAVRELLLAELASAVPRLRADAVTELARMRELPGFLDAEAVAAFAAFADAPALPVTQRLALVRLLEGAPGFDAPPRLRALAREAEAGPALAQLIRAAGSSGDPELRAWLGGLADDERPWVRREARAALGGAAATSGAAAR